MEGKLKAFRYRIVIEDGRKRSAIHTFYAPNQPTADHYAKAWASRRGASSLSKIVKKKRKA